MGNNWTEKALRLGLPVMFIMLAIQLIPYGHDHNNPPQIAEPRWDSEETRGLAVRACFDCHSNQTVWPWYSMVAPFSWLVYRDVQEGRGELNFSDWQGGRRKAESAEKMREEIAEGEMPPILYRLAHPLARLTEPEKKQLVRGLAATMK